jgi:hypothetical protein
VSGLVDQLNRYLVKNKNYRRLVKTFGRKNGVTLVMKGRNVGFFSIFCQVIGILDYCRRNGCNAIIDFNRGLYYEEAAGSNWWKYYFDAHEFNFGPKNDNIITVTDTWSQKVFSYYGGSISPNQAKNYVNMIGIKPEFLNKVEDFLQNENRLNLCGVHFRGTDKMAGDGQEAAKVGYDFVANQLDDLNTKYRFFVATDEQQFLEYVMDRFPGRVLYRAAFRSADARSIHSGVNGYSMCKAGEEALLDCLILSKCGLLMRTDSNLSFACRFFSPGQKNINLTHAFLRSRRG